MRGATAIVIGTGNFGRYYARIFSTLNKEKIPGIPAIETLIVTKTSLKRAQDMAHYLQTAHPDTISRVIGAKVCCQEDLAALLDRHPPHLTCIVASDKLLGDEVHAEYAGIALKKGRVLCEKPFSGATGDGSSLARIKALAAYPHAALFGLELPLIIARRQLLARPWFQKQLLETKKFDFVWGTQTSPHTDLIANLALHPWSLIPEYMQVSELESIHQDENTKGFKGYLYNPLNKQKKDMRLTLSGKNNLRAIETDGMALAFLSHGTSLNVVKLPFSLREAEENDIQCQHLPVLDTVYNPLFQHIVACLKGAPIVGLEKTHHSQLFLEMLKGYSHETQ